MLNLDFAETVAVDTISQSWSRSPAKGVWRKPLAREDAERGHATSIVRYDPGSSFRPHSHPGGEEILVLQGIFSDEHGDFPAGTYFRNPDGSSHAPFSKEGCLLLVKLCQFQHNDRQQLAIRTDRAEWLNREDAAVLPLHQSGHEQVAMVRLKPGQTLKPLTGIFGDSRFGEELLILRGALRDDEQDYPKGSWIRRPKAGHPYLPVEVDTLVWIKTGHLQP